MRRADIKMTGQNKVWLSGNVLFRSLLVRDADSIAMASKSIQEELNVFELTISPIVNLQEIINDDTFKANEIKTLFENLTFDDNLSMTNSFISNYKYHTLTCSFSPAADSQTIDIIIEYLNTNPLFTELKLRKMNSFSDRIESNEKAINQIDAIILKYTNEISNSSNTDPQLYVDNKDIRPNDLIKTKIELTKEIEILEGSLEMLEVPYEEVKVHIVPSRGVDIGAGRGEPVDSIIYGGVVGLIFDGRNRPITLSADPSERIDSLLNWSNAVDEYPKGDLF